MLKKDSEVYEFNHFLLDVNEQRLLRKGKIVRLQPKVFELLTILVRNSGRIMTKKELMQHLWADRFVEEHNITVNISELRQALGQRRGEHTYIETVPSRGYRFVACVREVDGNLISAADKISVEDRIKENTVFENADDGQDPKISAKDNQLNNLEDFRRFPSKNKQYRKYFLAIMFFLAGIIGIIVVLITINQRAADLNAFREIRVKKLTNAGNINYATISPDGRYIAYTVQDKEAQSIWLRQISTGSNVEVLQRTKADFHGLTFSRDGNYIYYLKLAEDCHYILYQLPVLGGVPKEVMTYVDSPVTFSPDGKQFAFVRSSSQGTQLVTANTDGSDERILAARTAPDFFTNNGPSWSPDGQIIATMGGSVSTGNYNFKIVGIQVNDGKERLLIPHNLFNGFSIKWLSDGSGFLVNAVNVGATTSPQAGGARQIWFISYPQGNIQKITNDFNDYLRVSVTDDSHTILTMQSDLLTSIWIYERGNLSEPGRQIITGSQEGFSGLSFAGEDKIVYASRKDGEHDIWTTDLSGVNKKRLTSTHTHGYFHPTVSPDGQTVIFTSAQDDDIHIWKMGADGSKPQQLTNGERETFPQISPDGKFIVYIGSDSRTYKLFKLPIDGGMPLKLTDMRSSHPAISPDGILIAFFYRDQQPKPQWNIGVIPFEGGEMTKTFPLPANVDPNYLVQPMRWSPNGQALTFVATQAGVSNLFELPIDGSDIRQLTNFDNQNIFGYEWSKKGNNLVLSRGQQINDIVMIESFKEKD